MTGVGGKKKSDKDFVAGVFLISGQRMRACTCRPVCSGQRTDALLNDLVIKSQLVTASDVIASVSPSGSAASALSSQ